MGKLFGTDGVRGVANTYPMTSEMALNIGRAVASIFSNQQSGKSKIIIGKDTRISGDMLEGALVAGICSMGVDTYLAGILPTPGIAHLTTSFNASAGIVISASHNPYFDNGIKIFNQDGFKLSDEIEKKIEQIVLEGNTDYMCASIRETGSVFTINDSVGKFTNFLKKSQHGNGSFKNLKIVLDCANGATFQAAPQLFSELGANIKSLFVHPDGKNINDNCGSQHPETLKQKVLDENADIGLAFDGDGDRLIAVDEKGQVLSGDQILAVCTKDLKEKGRLKNNLLVTTIMSNMGLGVALKELGIKHIAAKVGDRHVMEEMVANDSVIGGEDSGHMIFLDHHTTGDGIFASLRLIEAMQTSEKPLSELAKVMTIFPQELVNIDVKTKPDINTIPEISEAIKSVENTLGEKGRVLVRYSGTQPLCRVMVEGPTVDETQISCRKIADIIKKKLG